MKTAIGQDSHKFNFSRNNKKLILGGVVFKNNHPLQGNSDADVILHSITNAVSGITGVNILGKIADEMCKSGITDSKEYLLKAMEYLNGFIISHLSISVECKTPAISPMISQIKKSIGKILNLKVENIGLTATSGEGLTSFGKGEGIQVFSIITAIKKG
ncbi:MAG: 2-C-methyl-D-erythritol 2,4-cyclodiphosphate synthase [Candidatus Marinimicrobia bacterium]|nr:2-C-methyl-D-erythritol 2,4-cyclodiphosphate synthase [Candidatus Neomarinimicrobiota bacterium]